MLDPCANSLVLYTSKIVCEKNSTWPKMKPLPVVTLNVSSKPLNFHVQSSELYFR